MKKQIGILFLIILFPLVSFAYCPLCVGGVLAITFLGIELGIKKIVLGFLIGALSFAIGDWIDGLIKRKFFKYQKILIIALIYLPSYFAVKSYISDYHLMSLKNKMVWIDKSLIAGIFGGILVLIAPILSKWITQKTNKHILFQRLIITLLLIIIFVVIFQFLF